MLLSLCCSVFIMFYCYCVALLLFVLSYVLIVCTVPLPPGVNPIAVDKYIDIISYYSSVYIKGVALLSFWKTGCVLAPSTSVVCHLKPIVTCSFTQHFNPYTRMTPWFPTLYSFADTTSIRERKFSCWLTACNKLHRHLFVPLCRRFQLEWLIAVLCAVP